MDRSSMSNDRGMGGPMDRGMGGPGPMDRGMSGSMDRSMGGGSMDRNINDNGMGGMSGPMGGMGGPGSSPPVQAGTKGAGFSGRKPGRRAVRVGQASFSVSLGVPHSKEGSGQSVKWANCEAKKIKGIN